MTVNEVKVELPTIGAVAITVTDFGSGQPFLFLHGGGGVATIAGFAELFATTYGVRVLVPTHPGFEGTDRPAALHDIRGLAALYVALIDQLGHQDVTVVGNSMGGWIASEMALLTSPRISGVVLIDATGIEVPGHPVADARSLSMADIFALSFHDPAPFLFDPATLPPAALAVAASNQKALACYAGPSMSDPSLLERLRKAETPTLVLWGDSDRIADPDYGRAYAAALPLARFQLLTNTGHMPQVETPEQALHAIWNCGDTNFSDQRNMAVN